MSQTGTSGAVSREDAMRAVWEQHRGGILAKVGLIEQAVAALGTDRFNDEVRVEAQRSAHMLSGSLGMFGFPRASEAARELELEFAEVTRARTTTLSTLLAIVRRGLDWEPAIPPVSAGG